MNLREVFKRGAREIFISGEVFSHVGGVTDGAPMGGLPWGGGATKTQSSIYLEPFYIG